MHTVEPIRRNMLTANCGSAACTNRARFTGAVEAEWDD
jgi:hypothetical protein